MAERVGDGKSRESQRSLIANSGLTAGWPAHSGEEVPTARDGKMVGDKGTWTIVLVIAPSALPSDFWSANWTIDAGSRRLQAAVIVPSKGYRLAAPGALACEVGEYGVPWL